MRGKHLSRVWAERRNGITPADAGKTFCRRLPRADTRDHPRGCGENADDTGVTKEGAGSPPRMRGKLCRRINYWQALRITPADAGKTQSCKYEVLLFQDHPRGCGENTKKIL